VLEVNFLPGAVEPTLDVITPMPAELPEARLRSAILLAKAPDPNLALRIAARLEPRAEYVELAKRIDAEVIDFHDVERASSFTVRAVRALGGPLWGLAWLGTLRRKDFDLLYLTGEDVALRMGILHKLMGHRGRVTVVFHQVDTRKRRAVLAGLGHEVFAQVIVLSACQQRLLVEELGFPRDKVLLLHNWLDHRFFAPREVEPGAYVISVGMEHRDYPTLQAAAQGLPFRVHVVASGWSPGPSYGDARGISESDNITVGRRYDTTKLRDLYAGARFVVLPLKRVQFAAGVTAILEAMAMGKAVVVTDSPGLADYVRDRENGLVVPAESPEAMRRAMLELWENPALAAELGREGRRRVEERLNTDRYVDSVARLLASEGRVGGGA
jgi:glycosyltransferase involved in cell wall biosynthesis